MFNLVIFYLVSVVTGQNPWLLTPQLPPQSPWSPIVQQPWSPAVQSPSQDESWYNMDNDWEVSNKLMLTNQFYNAWRQYDAQMSMYAYAPHVGKINRGQFFNPELNMPRDRAVGYQHDFNPEDFQLGAFNFQPKGQKIRATQAHVNQGLASRIGDVAVMPIGHHVQKDGSVLVQTSFRQKSPCNPNPCKDVKMTMCSVVNDFTAKCSNTGYYELSLRWVDPDDDSLTNDLHLNLVAAFHNGIECIEQVGYLKNGDEDCGVFISEHVEASYDNTPNMAEDTATFTTLSDGTKFQDYTYAVFVDSDSDDNFSVSKIEVLVIYDGEVKQTLTVPQYDGITNINYDKRGFFFFGCFRPCPGTGGYCLNTNGAGFYDYSDLMVFGGSLVGLCNVQKGWTGTPGFNHYTDQGGSGDEN